MCNQDTCVYFHWPPYVVIGNTNFVKCYTFHIAKQQPIILSRTVQSIDYTAVSTMRFAHALPR
jgi:hypothetical protein